jgi:hypothetical protein
MFAWGETEHCDPQQPSAAGAAPYDYDSNLYIDYVTNM